MKTALPPAISPPYIKSGWVWDAIRPLEGLPLEVSDGFKPAVDRPMDFSKVFISGRANSSLTRTVAMLSRGSTGSGPKGETGASSPLCDGVATDGGES